VHAVLPAVALNCVAPQDEQLRSFEAVAAIARAIPAAQGSLTATHASALALEE
jgi:hypothetical protein